MLDLDPHRAPVAPRAAATVLVLRPSSSGLEIYCIVRHAKSGFMGGLVAFPGGKVDPGDHDPRFDAQPLHARALELEETPEPPRALAVAACREALEEAALVPTVTPLDSAGALSLRARLAAGASFADALDAAGLTLELSALAPFGRWITPAAEPRRFDAVFFLLASPPGQTGQHDAHETTDGFWRAPAEVLATWRRGELQLAPPTARVLELLSGCATLADARALADAQCLLPVCPELVADGGFLALPGDPAHSVRERRVAGPTRFVFRDGRFDGADP